MNEPPEMSNVAYCAGRDVTERPMADAVLAPCDLWQNRAHCAMLARCGIITRETLIRILRGLDEYERRLADGSITLDPRKEDIHTNIERFVASHSGAEHAGQMHTARSRNDQSATVMRLYVRDRVLSYGLALADLAETILRVAAKFRNTPIAGFTHYQPASITTVGHWFASYAQALLRDTGRFVSCFDRLNVCPLGAGAAFGTSWPIDRSMTAMLMGFRAPQINTLDCVTNRWEMEADAASQVSFAMTHLSIVSQDLILLSAPQLGIIEIADRYVTGSSIMPQKRNPDFAEVTRAKAAVIQNMTASLFAIARGLPSGYNRDTQWTKYLIMDVFDEAAAAPAIFSGVIATLRVNEARAERSAHENCVNAVDLADNLSRQSGLPFRAAYEIVSQAVKLSGGKSAVDMEIVRKLAADAGVPRVNAQIGEPLKIIAAKKSEGGPAPQRLARDLKYMSRSLKKLNKELSERRSLVDLSLEMLTRQIRELMAS